MQKKPVSLSRSLGHCWRFVNFLRVMSVVAIALTTVACTQTNAKNFPSDSVETSDNQVAQAALAYARDHNIIDNSNFEILFNQPMTESELAEVGLSVGEFAGQTPHLQLIIFKGHFSFSNFPHPTQRAPGPFPYVAYVVDLNAGVPTMTIGSYDGAEFKQVLGDSSLPTQN